MIGPRLARWLLMPMVEDVPYLGGRQRAGTLNVVAQVMYVAIPALLSQPLLDRWFEQALGLGVLGIPELHETMGQRRNVLWSLAQGGALVSC